MVKLFVSGDGEGSHVLSLSTTGGREEDKRSITRQREGSREFCESTREDVCPARGAANSHRWAFALVLVALIRGNFVRLGNISLPAASFREQKGETRRWYVWRCCSFS